MLQIVAFSVLSHSRFRGWRRGKPIIRAMESLAQIMFGFTNYVMMFAPISVGAAIAHT
jgi:Na+/H+-dicarboxylate symporter